MNWVECRHIATSVEYMVNRMVGMGSKAIMGLMIPLSPSALDGQLSVLPMQISSGTSVISQQPSKKKKRTTNNKQREQTTKTKTFGGFCPQGQELSHFNLSLEGHKSRAQRCYTAVQGVLQIPT